MGNPFTPSAISAAYNLNPPTDDAANTENNEVEWQKHVDKIGDPLVDFNESTDANANTAFAKVVGGAGLLPTALSRPGQETDQGKLISATASGIVLTTPDAVAVDDPFVYAFVNNSLGNITIDGNDDQTINGKENAIVVPPGKGGFLYTDGVNWFAPGLNFDTVAILPRSHLAGLVTAIGTDTDHEIDVRLGECRDSTNLVNLALAATFSKKIDNIWVPGSGNGGLADGVTLTTQQWLHMFLVELDGGETDVGFDEEITATKLLNTSGVGTKFRRIGAVKTDDSENLFPYLQIGDDWWWADKGQHRILDDVPLTDNAVNFDAQVPPGLKIYAHLSLSGFQDDLSSNWSVVVSDPDFPAISPFAFGNYTMRATGLGNHEKTELFSVYTNEDGEIRFGTTGPDEDVRFSMVARGWTDRRGRDD